MDQPKLSKTEYINECWRRGFLYYKCHTVQREMYKTFYDSEDNSTLVWLLARQSGKTILLCILALEQALKKPNSIIKLLTDTKIHMENIILPAMAQMLEDCPEDVKPEYAKTKFSYHFKNGSQIQLAGSDGKNYERLRGQKSDLVLVDEAGFCDDLMNVVKSVLLPTTTHTGGKIVLASTPPGDYDHDFLKFIEQADLRNLLTRKTIFENPLLSKEQVDRIIDEMGGVSSEQFRREYLCEILKDSSTAVLPEVTPALLKEIVQEHPKPPFYDTYESMDLGFNDLTVLLFAYYDFRAGKVIIEDEYVINGPELHLSKLCDTIKSYENRLWTDSLTGEVRKPYLRISDINHIVTNEILHNSKGEINFFPAKKDDNDSAINNLRMMLASKKIIINPRCKTLIRHLQNVKWASVNNKKTFARSPDEGHYDAVDAIKYLVRQIVYSKNPYPPHYNLNLRDMHIQNPSAFNPVDRAGIYAAIFGKPYKRK